MLGSVGRLAVLALPPLSSTFEARVLSRLHLCYPNFMLTCAIPMTSSHSTLRPLCICNRHLQKPLLSFRSRCVFAPFLFLFLALASGLSVPLWGCQFHWNWQRTLRTLRSVYRSKPRYRDTTTRNTATNLAIGMYTHTRMIAHTHYSHIRTRTRTRAHARTRHTHMARARTHTHMEHTCARAHAHTHTHNHRSMLCSVRAAHTNS